MNIMRPKKKKKKHVSHIMRFNMGNFLLYTKEMQKKKKEKEKEKKKKKKHG